MGYNRRFESGKMDIGSKGLVRDIIHNKSGYFAMGFNESKKEKCLNHILYMQNVILNENQSKF